MLKQFIDNIKFQISMLFTLLKQGEIFLFLRALGTARLVLLIKFLESPVGALFFVFILRLTVCLCLVLPIGLVMLYFVNFDLSLVSFFIISVPLFSCYCWSYYKYLQTTNLIY